MRINGLLCQNCGDVVFSRADHDMRSCTCGNVSIDGGFSYMKVTYKGEPDSFETVYLDGDEILRKVMHDDWNTNQNRFGRVNLEKTQFLVTKPAKEI